MKKISLLILIFISLNIVHAQNSLSKAQVQKEISSEKNAVKQTVMLSIYEYKDSERISVKTYGVFNSSEVSFQTSEEKEKFYTSMESLKKLTEVSTFHELLPLISSFNLVSHQVVAEDKLFKHYMILSL